MLCILPVFLVLDPTWTCLTWIHSCAQSSPSVLIHVALKACLEAIDLKLASAVAATPAESFRIPFVLKSDPRTKIWTQCPTVGFKKTETV